jgi:hypothetical protein
LISSAARAFPELAPKTMARANTDIVNPMIHFFMILLSFHSWADRLSGSPVIWFSTNSEKMSDSKNNL